jgi:hypothetical protein
MHNVLALVLAFGAAGLALACGGRYDALGPPADAGGDTGAFGGRPEPAGSDAGPSAPLHCPPGFTLGGGGCGRWTPAGQYGAGGARCETATLLLDGRLLLHGCGAAGAMIYDPATDAVQPAVPLAQQNYPGRSAFTATRLLDGRVLIAGGIDAEDGSVMAGSELFDPAAGTFRETPTWMVAARFHHAATLLRDGRVLVTGGSYTSPPPNAGQDEVEIADAEIFDPTSEAWSAVEPLPIGRSRHAALTLTDGNVLVVGGETTSGQWLTTTEVYDVAANQWESLPPLARAPIGVTQAVVLPGGSVLVASYGGSAVLDVARSGWTPTTGPGVVPNGGLAPLPGGRVLAIYTDPYALHANRAALYDPTTNSWSPTATPAGWHYALPAAALLDGRVFALGGSEARFAAEMYAFVEASP